jgi:hypothetical protein
VEVFQNLEAPAVLRQLARLKDPSYTKPAFDRVFQFLIDVSNSEWPIWRRIQVPETSTFWDLYVAINCALDWEYAGIAEFVMLDPTEMTYARLDLDVIWQRPLTRYLSRSYNTCICRIGGWNVSVVLESTPYKWEDRSYPFLLDGAGRVTEILIMPDSGYLEFLEDGSPVEMGVFDPDNIIFDDPDDVWISMCCEDPVMLKCLDTFATQNNLPSRHYRIWLPTRYRDLLLDNDLGPVELLVGTPAEATITEFVIVAPSKGELVATLRRIQHKITTTSDVRLRRMLRRIDWYLEAIHDYVD